MLHALGTKTSSRDGPELAGDSGVEVGGRFEPLRGWTRDESKSKLTLWLETGQTVNGTDCLTWGDGQRSSLGHSGCERAVRGLRRALLAFTAQILCPRWWSQKGRESCEEPSWLISKGIQERGQVQEPGNRVKGAERPWPRAAELQAGSGDPARTPRQEAGAKSTLGMATEHRRPAPT